LIYLATVLALTILAPKSGETVATLKDAQKAYLSGSRAERSLRMDNAADRAKLFAVGNRQCPLRLAWKDAGSAVRVTLTTEGRNPIALSVTNRMGVWVTNLELGKTYRMRVESVGRGDSAEVSFRTEDVPPRLLRADGVSNFRDLGGWKTAGGKRVRQNLIFRSAGLRSSSKSEGGFLRQRTRLGARRVTDAGIKTLKSEFGIRTDLELRTPQEIAGMETTLLGPQAQWKAVSFAAYDFIDNSVRGREPFAKIFKTFTKRENYPILMHCSGGRDRTGTLAFLLNGLLGVSEDDLLRDWEMSIFSDQGAGFSSDRIERLTAYLAGLPGDTLSERIEVYVKSCGIKDEEIKAFREIMLEDRSK